MTSGEGDVDEAASRALAAHEQAWLEGYEAGYRTAIEAAEASMAALKNGKLSKLTLPPTAPIEELDLMVRPYNMLKREGYHTIGDVIKLTDEQIEAMKSYTPLVLQDIDIKLEKVGYRRHASA